MFEADEERADMASKESRDATLWKAPPAAEAPECASFDDAADGDDASYLASLTELLAEWSGAGECAIYDLL